MEHTQTREYRGHHLEAVVEQRTGGPFPGQWFVQSQTIRLAIVNGPVHVPHVQHDGPFGSSEMAFEKAFRDLTRHIDFEAELEQGRRKGAGLE